MRRNPDVIILICPKNEETELEEVGRSRLEKAAASFGSVEEVVAFITSKKIFDPIITFAPTVDVLDQLTSSFQDVDGRVLIVIYGAMEDQAFSTQSYLIEACRKLLDSAKDGAN